ncbi:hypothetical protein ACLOJK_007932 [Asimina triloba]
MGAGLGQSRRGTGGHWAPEMEIKGDLWGSDEPFDEVQDCHCPLVSTSHILFIYVMRKNGKRYSDTRLSRAAASARKLVDPVRYWILPAFLC